MIVQQCGTLLLMFLAMVGCTSRVTGPISDSSSIGPRSDSDTLQSGDVLSVRVVDLGGAPIRDARVVFDPTTDYDRGYRLTDVVRQTGATGLARLADVPLGMHEIEVSCSGFVGRNLSPEATVGHTRVDVVLLRSAKLSGQLRDARGNTTSGYCMVESSEAAAKTFLEEMRVDPDGNISMTVAAEIPLTLCVGTLKKSAPKIRDIPKLSPGEHRDLGDLTLARGFGLAGTIVDTAGVGIPEVYVEIDAKALDDYTHTSTVDGHHPLRNAGVVGALVSSTTESSDDGEFEIAGLLPGVYSLDLSADGFALVHVADLRIPVDEPLLFKMSREEN